MTQPEKHFAVITWGEGKREEPLLLYWLNRNHDNGTSVDNPILACTTNSKNLLRDAARTLVIDNLSLTGIGNDRATNAVLRVEQFRSIVLPFLDENYMQVPRIAPIFFVKVQTPILKDLVEKERYLLRHATLIHPYSKLNDPLTRIIERDFKDFAKERLGFDENRINKPDLIS